MSVRYEDVTLTMFLPKRLGLWALHRIGAGQTSLPDACLCWTRPAGSRGFSRARGRIRGCKGSTPQPTIDAVPALYNEGHDRVYSFKI